MWTSKCELPKFQQYPGAAVPINRLPLRVVARVAVKREEALNRNGPTFQQHLVDVQLHSCAAVHVEELRPEAAAKVEVDIVVSDQLERVGVPAAPLRRRSRRTTP